MAELSLERAPSGGDCCCLRATRVKGSVCRLHIDEAVDELGRRGEDCSAKALEHVLGGHGALRLPEGAERPEELLDAGGVNDVSVRRSGGGAGRKAAAYGYGYGHGYGSGRRGGAYGGDEDYDSDDE